MSNEHSAEKDVPDTCLLADHIARRCQHAESATSSAASERAAGVLIGDIDTLASAIRRHPALPPQQLAEALVAAGFGDVTAARREIAEAERRGAERALRDLYSSFTDEDSDIEIALMGGDLVRVRILDAIDELGADS